LILEESSVWGVELVKVWYPQSDKICSIPLARLKSVSCTKADTSDFISFTSIHAKINDTLGQNELIAPILSSVIPLPHQLNVLSTAIKDGKFRLLLADEVGLGKTIEAGLIMRELKLRGLVKRVLVVAPKGLVAQWVAEMKTHFNEDFRLILPNETSRKFQSSTTSIWEENDNVVCPMDSVKPIEFRRGWGSSQVNDYNKTRFGDLIEAKWDLVIIDEAHRMGGSLDVIARYKLGKALSFASPYFLMLTATPHQGKTEAFFRLMQLLDEDAFPDIQSISKKRIKPFVIRTEKRKAIDAEGNTLFKPRIAHLFSVSWELRHANHKLLYESVTDYVKEGYNKAIKEKKYYQAFLMILMQRLVTSSTRAISSTLQKRLSILENTEDDGALSIDLFEDDWNELDSQSLIDELLQKRIKATEEEVLEIKSLIQLAQQCEKIAPDAKTDSLLSLLFKLQQEENEPHIKILIFTEFVSTQAMLKEFLEANKYKVVCLNGSMDLEERLDVQTKFAKSAQILISTDAGGEGINLQFCHVVINYDLPWNPMRIEQRIGRVDRIGQTKGVKAFNFVLQDTVEFRVREVLEAKLAVILKDLGIDKASDVLDTALSNEIFDDLYINAISNPSEIVKKIDSIVDLVKRESANSCSVNELLNNPYSVDNTEAKRLKTHPLPYWLERMTISYIRHMGGIIDYNKENWSLTWPDGIVMNDVIFTRDEAKREKSRKVLSLDNPKLQELVNLNLRFFLGQNIATVFMDSLSHKIVGIFSIWQITLTGTGWNKKRFIPLFINNDGRVLNVTAHAIWDYLLIHEANVDNGIKMTLSDSILDQHFAESEKQGKPIWAQLSNEYSEYLDREKLKQEYLFAAKVKALKSVGLENVKSSRLSKLQTEKVKFNVEFEGCKLTIPELHPVLFVHIKGVE
jgi:SNF2 family DNA or RNA helicase